MIQSGIATVLLLNKFQNSKNSTLQQVMLQLVIEKNVKPSRQLNPHQLVNFNKPTKHTDY